MSNDIIPFGKYKGQPIEVMAADQKYVEWLMQQPGIKDKYPNVYNTIINYTQEPAETPEHNAIQIKFLDPEFQKAFVLHVISDTAREKVKDWEFFATVKFEVGHPPIDVTIEGDFRRLPTEKEIQSRYDHAMEKHREEFDSISFSYLASCEGEDFPRISRAPNIEDCQACVFEGYRKRTIEVKPTVGDDYPAILRQMQKSGAKILLIGAYTGKGATETQLRAFFSTAEIRVILLSELGTQEV